MLKLKSLIMDDYLRKRQAFLIGVPKLKDTQSLIRGIKADIDYFEAFLKSSIGGSWDQNEIYPSSYTSINELHNVIKYCNRRNPDYLLLFFSGHGCIMKDNSKQYIKLIDDLVSLDFLKSSFNCTKILIIIDACRSILDRRGMIKEATKQKQLTIKPTSILYKKLSRLYYDFSISNADEGLITIYSADFNEESFADYTGSNFISTLLSSSINWAKYSTNSNNSLDVYNAFHKAKKTYKSFFDKQNPQITSNKRSNWFPFAIKL